MSKIRVLTLCGILLLLAPLSGQSPDDALPRRPWIGVALGPHERGVLVTGVVDGSSASVAGIRAGDIIRVVDGTAVRAPQEVISAVLRQTSGETTSLEIVRADQVAQQTLTLRPFPRETLPGVTFDYGAVTLADKSRLRTILTVPDRRDGRLPAVMLLQGGGCGSVDLPMTPDVGTTGLLRAIAAQGYVTMRVEKSGVGDSRGPACDAIGYTQELDGYRAALEALTRQPSVDPGKVFILGISLGGVFAPTLATETSIRGIVVWGTLAGPPSTFPGRSERFFREIASVDVAGAWSKVSSRVLVLRGQFDEVAVDSDHAKIAETVNARHPGAASYVELAGLDHCWTRHVSMDAGRGRCGMGEEVATLNDAVLSFLRQSL